MGEYMVRFKVNWGDGQLSAYQKKMKSPFLPRSGDWFFIDDSGGHWDEMKVGFIQHLETEGRVYTVVYLDAAVLAHDKSDGKIANDEWFAEKGWTVL